MQSSRELNRLPSSIPPPRSKVWSHTWIQTTTQSHSMSSVAMSLPYLPQEIKDQVIDILYDDDDTLRSCALVSRSWLRQSRKYLFAEVRIGYHLLMKWCRNIAPGEDGLSSLVRRLNVSHRSPREFEIVMPHLGSFKRVTALVISDYDCMDLDNEPYLPIAPDRYYGHFGESLRSLHLLYPSESLGALLPLVYLFPRLESLTIEGLMAAGDEHPPPPNPSSPTPDAFKGELNLRLLAGNDMHILSKLAKYPLQYDRVSIGGSSRELGVHFNNLISACSRTLKTLDISQKYIGRFFHDAPSPKIAYLHLGMRPFNPPLSVSSCDKLQEIIFSGGTAYPDHSLEEVLSSVTSPTLQKITIYMSALTKSDDTFGEISISDWDAVDRLMFELGKQRRAKSNGEGNLVVEIGIGFGCKQIISGENINLGFFLGRFRTVGEVRCIV